MNKPAIPSIVFFDIDGTIRYTNGQVPPSAIDAIARLRKGGSLAVVCSGRGKSVIFDDITSIGFDGMVASCGSYAQLRGTVLFDQPVPPDLARLTFQALRQCRTAAFLEGTHKSYLCEFGGSRQTPFFTLIQEYLAGEVFYGDETSTFNKFICGVDDQSDFDGLVRRLDTYYDIINHVDYLEFVPKGLHKGIGVQRILEYAGIPSSNACAFGDSRNDLEMLWAVTYSVAMGNAMDCVKKAARFQTAPLEEDGLAKGLAMLGLIE